jgi:flavin-dependent dehydrogenase
MRGGALQLARWGLLDRIADAGTPPVRTTTFHYEGVPVEVAIKARDGVDALYAPRRTLLDRVLVDAAEEAGAHVVHGMAVTGLAREADGRVRGAVVSDAAGRRSQVEAAVVVGADGLGSRVARLVGAEIEHAGRHAAACVYAHWSGLEVDGYHWHYEPGAAAGVIPTNDGETCVFVGLPAERFHIERWGGLESLYLRVLREAAPALADELRASGAAPKMRAFAGAPGFMKRSYGPGWALVGDAGYFRDPITAHGITDALRDAELLADAILAGSEEALRNYQGSRDMVARALMDVSDRVASFAWSMDEVRALHLAFSRSMAAGVDVVRDFDARPLQELPEPVVQDLL